MKQVLYIFAFTISGAVAAFATGCSHEGMTPAEACPVGTIFNPDSGGCDTVTS
ncbi:MAG: hypothetical protein AAF198_00365 [Pseudomonadota bacterium]